MRRTCGLISALLSIVLIAAGCGDCGEAPPSGTDAYRPPIGYDASFDAGSNDSAVVDASADDSASVDASSDAALPDSAEADAAVGQDASAGTDGAMDAAISNDAASADAASPDAASAAPQVVITELMADPCAVTDALGEWFEVLNIGADTVDMNGWVIRDLGSNSHTINAGGPLEVAPGARLVLGSEADSQLNGGVSVDYVYSSFTLAQAGDEIVLQAGADIVDSVAYDSGTHAMAACASLSLSLDALDSVANDDPANWCPGRSSYGDGDLGTPGAANEACSFAIGHCRLQQPTQMIATQGMSFSAYGRVTIPGLTDQSPGIDAAALVVGQLGIGPDGSDPASDPSWQWLDAMPDPTWDGDSALPSPEPNADEYVVSDSIPALTDPSYDYAFRFSGDGGLTWTSCDTDTGQAGEDGSENGYQAANAGQLSLVADLCDPNPCLTPDPDYCEGDLLHVHAEIGTCSEGGSGAECDYAPQTIDCAVAGGACVNGQCEGGAPVPDVAGQVIVTEVMRDPAAVDDAVGEWLELFNTTGGALNLQGCVLRDNGSNSHTIDNGGALLIPAQDFLVLGRNGDEASNGGVTIDYVYSSFSLGNTADDVILECDASPIDTISFSDAAGWPDSAGAAMNLDPSAFGGASNDNVANWCDAQTAYGAGDLGTPGAANDSCGQASVQIDWCRLQHPVAAQVSPDALVEVYGRLFVAGLTDQSTGIDADQRLVAEAGVGPDGSNPDGNGSWTWTAALANTAWDGDLALPVPEPNNDEYFASLTAPAAAASYDLAFRFSGDGGSTWTYCDTDAGEGADGSEDGYDSAVAGDLAVSADPCAPNPCVNPAPICEGDEAISFDSPGTCSNVGGQPQCEFQESARVDCSSGGQACNDGVCTDWRLADVGDLVISEVMQNPAAVGDTAGEWFEVHNPASVAVNLLGLVFSDDGSDSFAVDVDLVVDAGGYAVFGRNGDSGSNGGVDVDFVYSSFTLGNGSDDITVERDGRLVDSVTWDDGLTFPDPTGASMQLAPTALDATANDAGLNWCTPTSSYGAGDLGTPGAANDTCPLPTWNVNWCRLQHPISQQVNADTAFDVYGRVYIAGLTDQSNVNDEHASVIAEAGIGADGTDPASDGSWSWQAAGANPGWDGAAAIPFPEPDNDEYWVSLTAPSGAGAYDLAFRFSGDGGSSWTYCDIDAGAGADGSQDGYQVANAGSLGVLSDVCSPNPCTGTAPTCDGDEAVTYQAPGSCSDVGGLPQCDYAEDTRTDCSSSGQQCTDGSCADWRLADLGDLVVTEVMQNPAAVGDSSGEWFELHSLASDSVNLRGLLVRDDGTDSFSVDADVVVDPGGFAVLGNNADPGSNGGVVVDFQYSGFSLSNSDDEIVVERGGVEIDRIAWDNGLTFPDPSGASMQLDLASYDTAANDNGTNWCEASVAMPGGDSGSPGADNESCAQPDWQVSWCRLHWPAQLSLQAAENATVYGRVFVPGLSDQSTGTDPDPDLVAELGIGPDASDPASSGVWTWQSAAANTGWVDTAEPGNDEYLASLVAPATADSYDYAFRFSGDGGATWTYCDIDAGAGADGSEDGYQEANAGDLAVTVADPCTPNPCTSPDPPSCEGDELVTLEATGTCTDNGGVAECSYAEDSRDDCTLGDQVCESGACITPPMPGLGEVVITEIMRDPGAVNDTAGEWVELYNTTAVTLDLQACLLNDAGSDSHAIDNGGPLWIRPGGYLVLTRSADPLGNGGVDPDYTYSGFTLGNGDDEVILDCAAIVIDEVVFGDATAGWPGVEGESMSLAPSAFDASSNDVAASWCGASSSFGDGDLGTPGSGNDSCGASYSVDRCRLQWPEATSLAAGADLEVYGRLLITGLTDQSVNNDTDAAVVAALAWGDDDTDPSGWTGWVSAVPNPAWDGSAANPAEPDYDEYMATISAPQSPGSYDFAFRFSGDGGSSWTYCDIDTGVGGEDGSENGYQTANAGDLTVTASSDFNGDFEDWDEPPTTPDLWSVDSGLLVAQEDSTVHGGSYAVQLTRDSTNNADNDIVSTFIPVTEAVEYTLSVWSFDNDPDGRARIINQWFDASQQSLGGASYGSYSSDDPAWQEVTAVRTAPAGAAYVQVSVRVYAPSGQSYVGGTVVIDDVTVTAN